MMRRICWPAWMSAASLVVFVLLTAGCQASPGVVPSAVYEQVNADGREWTYDTAWQNIRKLNADIDAGDLSQVESNALFIASQMERLERGEAGSMGSSSVSNLIADERESALEGTDESHALALRVYAGELQDFFDAGDFENAKRSALLVYARSLALSAEAESDSHEGVLP